MKTILLSAVCLTAFIKVQAQTLFTYGGKPVSKTEFLTAFTKNPVADTVSYKAALQSYLDLYVNYKLKVQAAYNEKLNETDEYKNESDNFKKQLAETAINNEANFSSLVNEAFTRSQKDIELAQIFIPVAAGADTTSSFKKIQEAYTQLKSGKSFYDVVSQYTADSANKQSKGYIGYITVFTLPYEVENMVYALHTGGYTKPYHSSAGYHIFKVISERPAAGKRKIEHILFAMPESFSADEKVKVARTADSIYSLLQSGASFDVMQLQFSSKKNGVKDGIEVGVGQYDSDFENQVFSLKDAGDISKPFVTAYGYNIIKLSGIETVSKDTNDAIVKATLQEKVAADDRLQTAKQQLVQHWQKLTRYKTVAYNPAELWKYTDSMIQGGSTETFKNITETTTLFSFAKQKVQVHNWLQYVQMKQGKTQTYPALMKQFISYATTNYYSEHIEEYNTAIAPQLEEFNNANLLFAAMDKHVWSGAAQDSAGLLNYYNANHTKYLWMPGVSAVMVTASNKEIADEAVTKIKSNAADWRNITAQYGSLIQADSSRFEKDQLPMKGVINMQQGYTSAPEPNGDNAYTFIYITDVHTQPEQRSFDDARGLVINDYQQVIEDKWIQELKKKYPVVMNQQVINSL